MLVGNFPNPSPNCIRRMRAARSCGTLSSPYKQKSTPKADAKSTFDVLHFTSWTNKFIACSIARRTLLSIPRQVQQRTPPEMTHFNKPSGVYS